MLMLAKARQRQQEGLSGSTPDKGVASWMQTPEAYTPADEENETSYFESAVGVGEVILSLGTGLAGQVIGGAKAVGQEAYRAMQGDFDSLDEMVHTINTTVANNMYQPRTEAGKEYLGVVGGEFEKLGKDVKRGGEYINVGGKSGAELPGPDIGFEGLGPEAAALFETFVYVPPTGIKGAGISKRVADISKVKKIAKDAGVDMNAPKAIQMEQLAISAELQAGGFKRGTSLPGVVQTVQHARDVAKRYVRMQYHKARSENAAVFAGEAGTAELFAMIDDSLSGGGYVLSDFPLVQKRMKELRVLMEEDAGWVSLNKAELWRKTIGRHKAKIDDAEQNAALGIMKAQYDTWLDTKFNADMISGTPEAIAKWKKARAAHAQYAKTFKDEKVIRDLTNMEATPETARKWIFGTNLTGAKSEAAGVVKKIKSIVGEESTQFRALRTDAALDILHPLLLQARQGPTGTSKVLQQEARARTTKFIENYDNVVTKNPSLAKELFTTDQLKNLRDIANSVRKTEKVLDADAGRIVGVLVAGHQLARRALMVTGITNIWRSLTAGNRYSQKRQIMSDLLGYDPYAPLLPRTPLIAKGVTQAALDIDKE